ncbi:MAG: hypothetical protein L0Z62_21395 [Gemmataceae bacterium]|nr:hypothetical protein [Gemmataceae bacterium]
MLRRLLFLQHGELRRLLPFFGLYLLVFAALTLADGLSLALFVKKAGSDRLPLAYALTALANLVLIGLYLLAADRVGAVRLFQAILAGSAVAYLAAWAAVRWGGGGEGWYGLLFVSREITFTLVLMHFGTFVVDVWGADAGVHAGRFGGSGRAAKVAGAGLGRGLWRAGRAGVLPRLAGLVFQFPGATPDRASGGLMDAQGGRMTDASPAQVAEQLSTGYLLPVSLSPPGPSRP